MVSWIDSVIVILCIAVVLIEIKRGFGRTVFDFFALLISLRGASLLADPLANAINFSANTASNQGIAYAMSFVLLSVILVVLGHMLHSVTLFSADYLDPALGGVLGILVAVMLCHAFVATIFIMDGSDLGTSRVASTMLGYEFLEFPTYHRTVHFLDNFNRSSPELP